MKIIKINSPGVPRIINHIAEAWEVKVYNNWHKYTIKVPPTWGNGTISAYDLNDGMGLLLFDCVFMDDVELHFNHRPAYPLVLNYCMEGKLEAWFENAPGDASAEKYQSLILVNQEKKEYILRFVRDIEIKARTIQIDRENFHKKYYLDEHTLDTEFRELFRLPDKNEDSFYHNHMYSVILSHYFDEIDHSQKEGLMHMLEVKGLVLQILSEQLSLYKDDRNKDGRQHILRKYEISCIRQAAGIIEHELDELPNIPNLARRVGINTNKLQDGFKKMYKNTVNGYVQDVRMKRAAWLLHYSDRTVSEIVGELGLKSKSYFSRIFREQYGISPSGYRQRKQDGKKESHYAENE